MNFNEKFDLILTILNCTNAQIAKLCNIDASLVSRFRTGARIPRPSSSQFLKLCDGIASYAKGNHSWDKLEDECLLKGDSPENKIHSFLLPQSAQKANIILDNKPKPNTFNFFGIKLNTLMNMLNISNVRLARALSVDSSLISRFRRGVRTPLKNSPFIPNMCDYFYKKILDEGREDEFSELLNISKSMVTSEFDKLMSYFINWFSDKTEIQTKSAIDSFLEKLDALNVEKNFELPEVDITVEADSINDSTDEYVGIDGLRHAVIRFLSKVVLSEDSFTLKLYSDQSLDWLTSDSDFTRKWSVLMYAVIKRKTHIQIIHTIDRDLSEMLAAIEKWLPLYMTGMIEGFYCKKSGDTRFANTKFICPQVAAINSSFVAGTEDKAKHNYISSPCRIPYYEEQFDALLGISKPLIKMFSVKNIVEYNLLKNQMAAYPGKTKKLSSSFSIATLPALVLKKILIRNKIEQTEIEKIISLHKIHVKQFERELQNGGVIEHVLMPHNEAILAEDIELNIWDIFTNKPITYNSEEYSEHIEAIISLLDKTDNYHIQILSSSPFANIQITLKNDMGAIILKNNSPSVAFWFGHPMMLNAFDEYLSVIAKKSILHCNNKSSLYHLLEKIHSLKSDI